MLQCVDGRVYQDEELHCDVDKGWGQVVGTGSQATVYRIWRAKDSMYVAVKHLNHSANNDVIEFLLRQIRLVSAAAKGSQHIVKLLGHCREPPALVYEYMEGKDLYKLLQSDQHRTQMCLLQRVLILYHVACALEHLHHKCFPPILHRDLKPANILLDGSLRFAKLADFGTASEWMKSRTKNRSTSSVIKGTLDFLCPAYVKTGQYTTASDVYSFGIVVLQLLTGVLNRGLAARRLGDYVKRGQSPSELIDRLMPGQVPAEIVQELAQLAIECMELTPTARPAMGGVGHDIECCVVGKLRNVLDRWPSFRVTAVQSLQSDWQTVGRAYQRENICASDGSFGQKLGTGGQGCVYRVWSSDEQCNIAVKHLSAGNHDDQICLVRRETQLLYTGAYDNPHIVQLKGHSVDPPALVYEFMAGGDLQQILMSKERRSQLDLRWRVQIMYNVACALEHLHRRCSPAILHWDVKPHNILLDASQSFAKLADFGISKQWIEGKTMTTQSSYLKGTADYLCPVYIHQRQYTPASDVYSFGLVVLGLLTGSCQCQDSLDKLQAVVERGSQVSELVDDVMPGNICEEVVEDLFQLVLECVQIKDVQCRPAIGGLGQPRETVVARIRKILNEWLPDGAPCCNSTKERLVQYSAAEISYATGNFTRKVVEEGDIATVYSAVVRGKELAIKRLKQKVGLQQLREAVKVVQSVSSPHIVELVGTCLKESCFLYEHFPLGSVEDQFGSQAQQATFSLKCRLDVLHQLGSAVAFLHQRGYVHQALDPTKVMLSRSWQAKLGDVGLSMLLPTQKALQALSSISFFPKNVDGICGYLDPAYLSSGETSFAMDVYSYGVIGARMLTGLCPKTNTNLLRQIRRAVDEQSPTMAMELLDKHIADQCSPEVALGLWQLVVSCTQPERQERPLICSDLHSNVSTPRCLGTCKPVLTQVQELQDGLQAGDLPSSMAFFQSVPCSASTKVVTAHHPSQTSQLPTPFMNSKTKPQSEAQCLSLAFQVSSLATMKPESNPNQCEEPTTCTHGTVARAPQDAWHSGKSSDFQNFTSTSTFLSQQSLCKENDPQLKAHVLALQAHLIQLQSSLRSMPCTAAISQQERNMVRARLVSFYGGQAFSYVPHLFSEKKYKHVDKLECHLILRQQARDKVDSESAADGQTQLSSHQANFQEGGIAIPFHGIFRGKGRSGDGAHRVLVTGDPGTGKTTLTKKLVYQWSQGAWGKQFNNVYLLPVRNLLQSQYDDQDYSRRETLATAVVNNCLKPVPEVEDSYNRIREVVKLELLEPSTLVILDGLDERQGSSQELLRQAQEGQHKVLMLSRPYGIEIERQIADTEIFHAGLDQSQMKLFVQDELQESSDLADKLLRYIHQHERVRLIAHVPVNLAILCALWQDDNNNVWQPVRQASLPGLYRLLTEFIWKRYTTRCPRASGEEEGTFHTLGQIALAALMQGQVLISPGLVHKYAKHNQLQAKLMDAGFLLLQSIEGKFFQFPHLTFQEYFAGLHLAQSFLVGGTARDKVKEILSDYKYNKYFRQTFLFLAGVVGHQVSSLSQTLQASLFKELVGLVGTAPVEVVGWQHSLLEADLLAEYLLTLERIPEEAVLLEAYPVINRLREWLNKGLELIGMGYLTMERRAGTSIIFSLARSLTRNAAILTYAPSVLGSLRWAVCNAKSDVRIVAVKAIAQVKELDSGVAGLLRQSLQDEYANIRQEATKALAHLKAEDVELFASLAAEDKAEAVRCEAVKALGFWWRVGPRSCVSVRNSIRDSSANVRRAVVKVLGRRYLSESAALELLHQAANDDATEVCTAALEALGCIRQMDPSTSVCLLKAMMARNKQVRLAAIKALSTLQMADPSNYCSCMRQAIAVEQLDVQCAAVEALGISQNADPETLDALHCASTDQGQEVRRLAIRALSDLKACNQSTIKLFWRASKDNAYDVRLEAIKALEQLELMDVDTQQVIISALLTDVCDDVRGQAAKALSKRQIRTEPDILIQALQDSSSIVRRRVINILGYQYRLHPGCLQLLQQAVKDEDATVRTAAVQAMGSVQPCDRVTSNLLSQAVKDEEDGVRLAAVASLRKQKIADPDIVRDLIHSTLDKNLRVRLEGANALAVILDTLDSETLQRIELGSNSRSQGQSNLKLRILQQALQDDEQQVRLAAARTLGEIATTDPDTLRALQKAGLQHKTVVCAAAIDALRKMGAADQGTLDVLHKAARTQESRQVRCAALRALGNLGVADEKTLHVLHQTAIDERDLSCENPGILALRQLAVKSPLALRLLYKILAHSRSKAGVYLRKIPTVDIFDSYWATQDEELLRFMAYRLLDVPLIIHHGKVALFLNGGIRTWQINDPDADLLLSRFQI